jgi:hypothetical protein
VSTPSIYKQLHAECEDLRAQLAAEQARAESAEKERDEARMAFEQMGKTAEIAAADQHRAIADRDAWRLKCERAEAELQRFQIFANGLAGYDLESTVNETAARIAAWLSTWEPDYYAEAADNQSMTTDAVLLLAADRIKAGNWRAKASRQP